MYLPHGLNAPTQPRNLLLKCWQSSYILLSIPADERFLQSRILPSRSNCKNSKPGMTENHTDLTENWHYISKNKFQFQPFHSHNQIQVQLYNSNQWRIETDVQLSNLQTKNAHVSSMDNHIFTSKSSGLDFGRQKHTCVWEAQQCKKLSYAH